MEIWHFLDQPVYRVYYHEIYDSLISVVSPVVFR